MLTPLMLGSISAVLIALGLGLVLRDMWRAKTPKAARTALSPSPAEPSTGTSASDSSSTQPRASAVTTVRTTGAPSRPVTSRPVTSRPVTSRTVGSRHPSSATTDEAGDSAVTIVHRTAPPSPRTLRSGSEYTQRPTTIVPGESPAFDLLQSTIATISSEALTDTSQTGAEGQRWPNVEKRWLSIAPDIDTAVAEVNAVLAGVELQVGPAGESGWSFKNRGYGAFRRVLLNGRSIAWLRIELTNTGQLAFKTRSHAVEQALLNATADVKADASMRILLDGLSKAIRPAAEFAAWNKPRQKAEAEASQDGWAEIAAVASQALAVAATAFQEAGADLVESAAPSWDAASNRHRWPLAMKVGGNVIGRVNVDLIRRALEVSVDEPGRLDLARRQAIDTLGLTPHALAEVIANCAWPTIAQSLQQTDATALGYAG